MPQAVRAAVVDDARALVPLLGELGYPSTADDVAARLRRAAARDDSGVFVVDEDDSSLAGFLSFHLVERFATGDTQLRITAFAVAASVRRRGVGGALLRAAEDEARRRGCDRIEVTSAVRAEREPAHAFYEATGFVEKPRRFLKKLR